MFSVEKIQLVLIQKIHCFGSQQTNYAFYCNCFNVFHFNHFNYNVFQINLDYISISIKTIPTKGMIFIPHGKLV